MPSTAPTLTWQMTNLRAPDTENTPQDVLDTIALCVGDSTTWEVKSSAAGYIEIGPVAGSAIPNFRAIIAFGINAAQRQEPHDATAVNADELWMGIAPDGGTLGDPLGAADPYGAARWSLYWRISEIISGAGPVNQVFCVTSDEVFSVWLNDIEDIDWWGGICGAMFDPPTDADGEGTPGRVYGMSVTGRSIISATFWGDANGFLNSSTSGTGAATGCFRPALTTRWTNLDRPSPQALVDPQQTTEGGTRFTGPVPYYQTGATTLGTPGGANPTNGIGILRQIRYTQEGAMRDVVLDNAEAVQGYVISGADGYNDAVSFDNG